MQILENEGYQSSNKTPNPDRNKALNLIDIQQLDSNFTLDLNSEDFEDFSISPKLLKESFSSQENFYCKICNNLIVNISQCGKCEILYCKKCIAAKLETNENCPNCGEAFEFGNVPKITKNILNGFKMQCPFNCAETVFYSNILTHIKECNNKGKVFNCRVCQEKILVSKSKLEENNYHKLLSEHFEFCPERSSQCDYCKQKLLRKDLKTHIHNCEERIIKCDRCLFTYPFKVSLSTPHDENHCVEIRRLRKNLELFGRKNGI